MCLFLIVLILLHHLKETHNRLKGRACYSHKFHGAGLRYEIGISVFNANIGWLFGPFPCGFHSDLRNYKMALNRKLLQGERVIANGRYKC